MTKITIFDKLHYDESMKQNKPIVQWKQIVTTNLSKFPNYLLFYSTLNIISDRSYCNDTLVF